MAIIKNITRTAKKSAKRATLAAVTTAMCVHMGISDSETAAAKAALSDIAKDMGLGQARAIIVSMNDPFGPFNDGGFCA